MSQASMFVSGAYSIILMSRRQFYTKKFDGF